MSSVYTGNPANISLGVAPAVTTPSDGDTRNATSVNPALDKLADYIEALRQSSFLGSGIPINEGFESTTFPPASPPNSWKVPSVNFGTDSSWIRTTTTPLAGTASASAPTPQTLSTNSSISLTTFLTSPSRLAFVFSVTCNTNSDFLQLFIDGTLFASFSSGAANANKGGRWISDVLREGVHTFDWRFVRGASASVAGELCKVDTVEVIPEIAWFADDSRLYWKDDFTFNNNVAGAGLTRVTVSGTNYCNNWVIQSDQVAQGTYGQNVIFLNTATLIGQGFGVFLIQCPANAIGDEIRAFLTGVTADGGGTSPFSYARRGYLEGRIGLSDLTNVKVEFGLDDDTGTNCVNQIAWVLDTSLGTTWRLRTVATGVTVDIDTGILPTGAFHRFGISYSDSPVNSIVFTYDGKSIPVGTGLMSTITNIPTVPTGNFFAPGFRIRSVTAINSRVLEIDWVRYQTLR